MPSSNENETPVEVFFDDFKVEQIKSPVVQTNDYYPFGLAFNSYRRENSLDQKYLYNGKELQDELNLGWLDYGARAYMPDIGRWTTLDPLLEKFNSFSPYSYCLNNPIVLVDPDGMASRYNWETNTYYDDEDDDGQQDDGERTTTWGQVQKEYGVGAADVSGSTNSANADEQGSGDKGGSSKPSETGDAQQGRPNVIYVYSPDQAQRIKDAINDGMALNIAMYSISHRFVDAKGNPSNYAQRLFSKRFPKSTISFPVNGYSGMLTPGHPMIYW